MLIGGEIIRTMGPEADVRDRKKLDRLLLSIADGNREALGELYGCARGAVYGLALSILKNSQDAQDITQDTFVKIWESAGYYRSMGSPMAWILTIARNLSRMRLRVYSHMAEFAQEQWDAIPAGSSAVTVEDRVVLQTVLAALEDQERQVVLLHAASGLKFREIAALMEQPVNTILSRYHRAIKKMSAQLKGDVPL